MDCFLNLIGFQNLNRLVANMSKPILFMISLSVVMTTVLATFAAGFYFGQETRRPMYVNVKVTSPLPQFNIINPPNPESSPDQCLDEEEDPSEPIPEPVEL